MNISTNLLNEAFDSLYETWDTCPTVSFIEPLTLAHGWKWDDDKRHLRFVNAPDALIADPGITLDDVRELVRSNQEKIDKRCDELDAAARTAISDAGMPLEFGYHRKTKKKGPSIDTVMENVGYLMEQQQELRVNFDFEAKKRLDRLVALFEEDLEQWCKETSALLNDPIRQRMRSGVVKPKTHQGTDPKY